MSIDILQMRGYVKNDRAIAVALPVIAVECEATPPIPGYMDAYETAVLKFVDIGLSARGIARAMNAAERLIESVMIRLQEKGYLEKESRKPWYLTTKGIKYLSNGEDTERAMNCSQYGYMFINAISKDVFPFFLEGDINQVALFSGKSMPYRLTDGGDEKRTFSEIKVEGSRFKSQLRTAYKQFCKIREKKHHLDEGDISYDEAVKSVEDDDLFLKPDPAEDFDSFDEAELDEPEIETMASSEQKMKNKLTAAMFVRPLKNSKKNMYLHMRIIIDPGEPSGYKVESPFKLGDIDNGYFLRQVQWLAAYGKTKIGDENLKPFIEREIKKISPSYQNREKAFEIFVLEKLPLLKSQRNMHGNMYGDMVRIYSLMKNQPSLLEKENIVGNISRSVLECLYNGFFKKIDGQRRKSISNQARADLKALGTKEYIQSMLKKTRLDPGKINWSPGFMNNVIGRLETTKGNSTLEKFINITVINYYIGTVETDKLLNSENIQEIYEYTDELNQIRRKVSHDTDDRFEERDYERFMAKVFKLVNWLLEVYREE